MKLNSLSPKTKFIMFLCIVFALICILMIAINSFTSSSTSDDRLTIKNLDQYPIQKKDTTYIVGNIYNQTLADIDTGKSNPKHVAVIRDNSFKQESETSSNVNFILDVETAKRSWKVTLRYLDSGELMQSGVVTSCLPEKERIYQEDNECKDWSMEAPLPESYTSDVLTKELPYTGQFFTINAAPGKDDGSIFVAVDMQVNSLNTSAEAKENYKILKERSLKWIRDTGANPNNYTIEWRDYSGRPIERNKK